MAGLPLKLCRCFNVAQRCRCVLECDRKLVELMLLVTQNNSPLRRPQHCRLVIHESIAGLPTKLVLMVVGNAGPPIQLGCHLVCGYTSVWASPVWLLYRPVFKDGGQGFHLRISAMSGHQHRLAEPAPPDSLLYAPA